MRITPIAAALCTTSLALAQGNDLIPDIPVGPNTVRLVEVASVAPDRVIDMTPARDASGRLFIVSPQGVVRIYRDGVVEPTPFLDDPAFPTDRAMSSIAFHPNYAQNGLVYAITGQQSSPGADYLPPQNDEASEFDNMLVEYTIGADPDVIDPATRRDLLRVHQAHRLHNLNDLCFGNDGHLYISVGDGGPTRSGAPTEYQDNALDTQTPYGSILRIDVDDTTYNGRYAIPPGNPFAPGSGDAPEIFAWGLRNPWRISTDRATGDIYCATNGDITIEQIHRIAPGDNYAWSVKEGSFLWDPATGDASIDLAPDPQYTPPLAEYDHNNTTPFGSVIGGFVYRGSNIPELNGKYLAFDYVAGALISMDTAAGALEIVGVHPDGAQLIPFVDICWGEDENDEQYIGRITGEVLKLVRFCEADVTTAGSAAGSPLDATPDGNVTGIDLLFFVNAWLLSDPLVADLTTTGSGAGDPGFGVPDGDVTTADLNYYVNLWTGGC